MREFFGTRRGSLELIPRRGPPVLLHWSLPLGMLLLGFGTWGGAIGFVLLVLAHELGHHALVRRRRLRTLEIMVHGAGGECRYSAERATPYDRALIAWGGVLAQSLVFVVAFAIARTFEHAPGPLGDLLFVLLWPNAGMAVLNLLPVRRLDGELAWKLPGMWIKLARRRGRERQLARLKAELERAERERHKLTLH